jgi:riboflavin kinase/FMN adenylyltransferase
MIHTLAWNDDPPEAARGGALTIGNFDGVHRGHAAILTELRQRAQSVGGPAVALSFDPHPLKLLRPEVFQPVLTAPQDRAELLTVHGADHVLLLQTNFDMLALAANDFYQQVIRERLDAHVLVEGADFRFGQGREGSIDLLRDLGRSDGMEVAIVPAVTLGGRPVSSSRVRDALVRGAVREAGVLLDRPYRIRGTVVTGQKRGRTIGFPTANLDEIPTLIPGDGVYAVRVLTKDRTWRGAANIGPNPTFGENARKIEVHLIGFTGELVGESLAADFLERLRDTRPFPSVHALVEQLRLDIDQACQIA